MKIRLYKLWTFITIGAICIFTVAVPFVLGGFLPKGALLVFAVPIIIVELVILVSAVGKALQGIWRRN